MNVTKPYLSLVATSRNDDHGGSLTRRMQTFVDSLLGQCRRHSLQAELILVEWNPPPDRPPLAEALRWPSDCGSCRVRIVEVPPHIHGRYQHARSLPLYQMIGKNAGIRRAQGRFVLATNIDILFSDELVRFVAGGGLRSDRMYRIDRHDVMSDVPVDGSVDEQLEYCRSHILRVNTREGTCPLTLDGRVPDGVSAAPVFGRDATGGIAFGSGWHPAEQHSGEIFRWADHDPQILISPDSDRRRTLLLEIEPGPSVGAGPLVVEVSNSLGGVLETASISERAWLCVRLPFDLRAESLRFHVVGGALPVKNDNRILNFRLFRHEWVDSPDSSPSSVFVRKIPLRRRVNYQRERVSRLVRGLGGHSAPTRFGVPFSRGLVRALGLRLDASGLSLNLGAESRHMGLPTAMSTVRQRPVEARPTLLHTNACGDFTLMARERWLELRGYPEFDAYSFNIDSILCMAAHHGGVTEEILSEPMRIYHIEHGFGSGWTPEGEARLFERLAANGIPYIDWPEVEVWRSQMHRLQCPIIFNGDRWGLADDDLRETVIRPER